MKGFFSRFTRRRSPERPIEDWAVGDLAECIVDGQWVCQFGTPQPGPDKGDVLKVVAVDGPHDGFLGPIYVLSFGKWPRQRYHCNAFRKVPPISDEEAERFAAMIKAKKPVGAEAL